MSATNDIKQRLELILPYPLSSEKLKWQPFYVIYKLHIYSRDILTAIVGLGIAPPIIGFVSSSLTGNKTDNINNQSLLETLPPIYLIPVLMIVILSVIMRVYITTEQVEKRAVLAKSCHLEFRRLLNKIHFALQSSDPKPEIIQIQNEVTQIVRRHIDENSYPWAGFAPGTKEKGKLQAEQLCETYGRLWSDSIEQNEEEQNEE